MSTPVFILMAVSLPLGIILVFVLVNRYEAWFQARIHWVYILIALLQIPGLYKGFESRTWGFGFWLAVIGIFLAVALIVYHFREIKRQGHPGQEHSLNR
ncbi:MAG: hypothetical protein LC667_08410 [Thioalkalivibrio sp.]|nr:hypothetical protein [Thioalkalivibrio sp.]